MDIVIDEEDVKDQWLGVSVASAGEGGILVVIDLLNVLYIHIRGSLVLTSLVVSRCFMVCG